MWAAYITALLAAVLSPMPVHHHELADALAFDGSHLPMAWLADAIRNLVLFAPIGAMLVASGRNKRSAIAIGLALSLTIELIQLVIPGRFASPLDLATNALGTAAGTLLFDNWRDLVRPTRDWASRLSLIACIGSGSLVLTAAWLLQPAFPLTTYSGGWTPDLGNFDRYQGRVVEAQIGSTPIPPAGPAPDSEALRQALAQGAPLFVRAIAGPAPSSLAPLVTIHDEHRREILLIGIDANDLVIRQFLRANAMGFENPSLRLSDPLLGLTLGESFSISMTTAGPRREVKIVGTKPVTLSWTPGRSWALLLPLPTTNDLVAHGLDFCWIALLVFPASFWARRRVPCWLGVGALLLTLAALPPLGAIGAFPGREWFAAIVGASMGFCASGPLGDHPPRHEGSDESPSREAMS